MALDLWSPPFMVLCARCGASVLGGSLCSCALSAPKPPTLDTLHADLVRELSELKSYKYDPPSGGLREIPPGEFHDGDIVVARDQAFFEGTQWLPDEAKVAATAQKVDDYHLRSWVVVTDDATTPSDPLARAMSTPLPHDPDIHTRVMPWRGKE